MGNSVEQWRASIGIWTGRYVATAANGKIMQSSSSPWFLLLVLLVLLLIGGIELNPGPIQAVSSHYTKRTGVANMSGEKYEVKMSTLLFIRAINNRCDFRIASNMAAAGSCDDIVFTMGDQTAFLQLKHRQSKDAKIYTSQLLTLRGDFSLIKYFKSYLEMKQQWKQDEDLQRCGKFEDAWFIVFTNAKLVDNIVGNVCSKEILDLLNTHGNLTQFTKHHHPQIYELFKSLHLLCKAISDDTVSDKPELHDMVRKLLKLYKEENLVKLLELGAIEDLSCYKEFLSRLCFCSGQTAESGLDSLIRSELITLFGNDSNILELERGVENWWRESNDYLTVQSKFFQDIIQDIAANIAKDVSQITVNFSDKECDLIRDKFKSSMGKLYVDTTCINLSSIKITQSLKTNLLVDISTMKNHLTEILAVWRLGMCDVLVVEGETTDTNILCHLSSVPHCKGVVIVSEKSEHIQLYHHLKFVSFADTFTLSQLDSNSQSVILEHEVIFQGFPVKLNSLADVSFLQQAVTADVVIQLDHTVQIGQKLQDVDPLYLPRTFLRREYVSEQIFREKYITLAVTGMSESTLAQLVPPGEKIQKFNPDEDRTCRFFLIEGEAEFRALCGEYDNIHWIEGCAEGFLWKNSKGALLPIVKHIKYAEEKRSYFGAEAILELPHQVVLLVAKPGMGKSTEMCEIAHVLKQKDPSSWVVRVDLNQSTILLSECQLTPVEFLEGIEKLEKEFERRLFEHQVQSGGNVVIILDGVDEVSSKYSKRIFDLLTELSTSKVAKIFVTSRPVLRSFLEDRLNTLAFSFKPFTQEDQRNFLMRYWNELSVSSPNLPEFITSLLQLVGSSLNDKLSEFTGIPLQCRMLAEAYVDNAAHFCQTGESNLPQSLDLLQLYEKFIDKKWEVFFEKFHIGARTGCDVIEELKDMFHERLMCCALMSYLHYEQINELHNAQEVVKQNWKFIEKFSRMTHKIGIVNDIINKKAVFVHRTFTEYFVASWFSLYFNLELSNIRKIYLDENFEIVRMFLDRIINKENILHTATLNGDVSKVKNLLSESHYYINQTDKGGRTALHLAIMNYYKTKHDEDSLLETLLDHGADVNCKDKVLHWSPLRFAEEFRAWSVVDKLLGRQADTTDLVWIRTNLVVPRKQGLVWSVISVLKCGMCQQYRMNDPEDENSKCRVIMNKSLQHVMHIAARKGYVNLIEFILKCGVSVDHHIGIYGTMLCIAAKEGQLRLVQYLLDQEADLQMPDYFNRTPLMYAAHCGHVEVAKLLIEHGANVNARDRDGYTALTIATWEGKYEVVKLLQKQANINISDKNYTTQLMCAAQHGDLQVAEHAIQHGADINARDRDGYTALTLAAGQGKYVTVELLLQNGADVEISDECNRSPLMWAAQRGHIEVAELFIEHGANVNARDIFGHTALTLAIWSGHGNIKQLLLQHRAHM